jgi:hypothetical protein
LSQISGGGGPIIPSRGQRAESAMRWKKTGDSARLLQRRSAMKRRWSVFLVGAAIASFGGAAAAHDRVGFSVSIGVPAPYVYSAPVVVAPAPVYYPARVIFAPPPPQTLYHPPHVVVVREPWAFRSDRHDRHERGHYGHHRDRDRRW